MEGEGGDQLEIFKKKLFKIAMGGKWKEVVGMYKNDAIQKAKITKSGDTALHVAVCDGEDDVVAQMVEILLARRHQQQPEEVLQIQNERGNTALHFAASMGNAGMCYRIGNVNPSLVGIRNVDGETPLFLAALHGRKEAFFCLHYICSPPEPHSPPIYANCRRHDGDTILHCAIAGDYFELAFEIIQLYGDLVNWVNEEGFSPLHLLATKPSAFKSGSHLGKFDSIIYHSLYVDKPQVAPYCSFSTTTDIYPENYQTCMGLLRMLKKGIMIVASKFTRKGDQAPDDHKQDLEGQKNIIVSVGDDAGCPVANKPPFNKLTRKRDQAQDDGIRAEIRDEPAPPARDSINLSDHVLGSRVRAQAHKLLPPNYKSCFDFVKFLYIALLVILGLGSTRLKTLRRKKEKHLWAAQIMDELLQRQVSSLYEYEDSGGGEPPQKLASLPDSGTEDKSREADTKPYGFDDRGRVTFAFLNFPEQLQPSNIGTDQPQKSGDQQKDTIPRKVRKETPILIAAKNGVTEMVKKILEIFPVAAHDMDAERKNIVLLAVENRHSNVYQLLLQKKILKESLFRKVDHEGNSALHLAAKLGEHKPWRIPGEALQMQWEIKWFEFVKQSMPAHFFVRYNKKNKTPKDIFTKTHQDLVKSGGEWLNKTSESCSVVAALIATVAFATSTTVPGGVQENTGAPTLEGQPVFSVFAVSSLVALCCSVTSVVLFLSILTSRHQEFDFGRHLPRHLILGLTSLFMSICAMLVSFCAGHFFVLKDKLRYAAFPVYAVTCLPATLFALAQFPLYFDLVWATFKKVPLRSYKTSAL